MVEPEKRRKYARERYAKAKELGVCAVCWKAPAVEGKALCQACADEQSFVSHINYIKRKFGVSREEAMQIYEDGDVQRFTRKGHIPKDGLQVQPTVQEKDEDYSNASPPYQKPKATQKRPPKPEQSVEDISRLAKEASEAEQHYISYGEMVARQSGAYNWKIGGKK